MLPARDSDLIQIVDASLASATARSQKSDGTSWLACRPGCTPCCHGVFRISQLDAERLRAGLRTLEGEDPHRAEAIRARATRLAKELAPDLPGDPRTGLLTTEDDPAWDTFADLPAADAACPALDPSPAAAISTPPAR